MPLTLSARQTASRPTRRLPQRRMLMLAVVVVAGVGAPLLIRPMVSPASPPAEQPVWAGAIGGGIAGPIVMPTRETSASYTSPVAIQAASRVAKPCAEASCGAPQRDLRTVLPPRRPAPEPVVAAAPPAPIGDSAAAQPKPKSIFSPAGLIERLPKADTLLKPFTTVGDKMSGLIKRF